MIVDFSVTICSICKSDTYLRPCAMCGRRTCSACFTMSMCLSCHKREEAFLASATRYNSMIKFDKDKGAKPHA